MVTKKTTKKKTTAKTAAGPTKPVEPCENIVDNNCNTCNYKTLLGHMDRVVSHYFAGNKDLFETRMRNLLKKEFPEVQ